MADSVEELYDEIIYYCQSKAPEEACGFIFCVDNKYEFKAVDNVYAGDKTQYFAISIKDSVEANSSGNLYAVVHSHTGTSTAFTQWDVAYQKKQGIPWMLVNISSSPAVYWLRNKKSDNALYGRQYVWHVNDCYSFIKDWYEQEQGILLNDYMRSEDFAERGQDLYLDNFAKEGFSEVPLSSLQYGDLMLFKLKGNNITSHAGVYVGENLIAHHLNGRLSKKDFLGTYYKNRLSCVVRHKDMFK